MFYFIIIFSCQNKRCWAAWDKLKAFVTDTEMISAQLQCQRFEESSGWQHQLLVTGWLLCPMMPLAQEGAAAHSGEFLRLTFSQWNFKYGTAVTLGIQTPGSFPLEYEKIIIFPISQTLIFTMTVMNIRTYCKHTHKNRNKINNSPPKNKRKWSNLSTRPS